MQPNRKQILRAVCVASLAIAARNSRADNLWLNSSHNGLWDTGTSHNWQNPVTWTDNDNALFDSAGNTKVITLNGSISVANLTFNAGATGDLISGGGAWSLTLNNAAQNPPYPYAYSTITQNGSAAIGAQLQGSGGLFFTGTGTTTLLGDTNSIPGNQYTGGTYIHSGTVVLQTWAGSASTLGGGSWGIDSLEALDPGATLRIGIIDNGPGSNGGVFGGPGVTDMPKGLLGTPGFSNTGAGQTNHLHLTGGTLDLNGWSRNNGNSIMPCPDGTGLIINNSSNIQSALVIYGDGQDHTFAGSINDGGPLNITGSGSYNDKGYQIGIIDLHYGAGNYVWTLAGTNTYSGSTRLGNASIRMGNDGNGSWGTLGIPSQIGGVTGPLRVYYPYFLDLNGTSQQVGGATHTGGSSGYGKIYNSRPGTVSTFNFGPFGSDSFSSDFTFQDNDGVNPGGILALNMSGSGTQGMTGANTYSGDTTLTGSGSFAFTAAQAVSHNTSFKLTTTAGSLTLGYSGSVNVRSLYVNGVRLPDGVYGAGTAPIAGASTGTIDVSPWIWNGASSANWSTTENNWSSTSPDTSLPSSLPWFAGREAVFGASAQKNVSLAEPISLFNLTFNTAGYTIAGNGNTLNMSDAGAGINANADAVIAANIAGTSGQTFAGTGTVTLQGDGASGNTYTGGTYIHKGTVVLQAWAAGAQSLGAASWGIDSLEALDTGATLRIGVIDAGPGSNGGVFGGPGVTDMPKGQIGCPGFSSGAVHHLHLTGGTLDLNGWSRNNGNTIIPPPDGTGLIVNGSSNVQSALVIYGDGQDHTFSGSINDGGPLHITGAGSYNDKGYQMGILDLHYGSGNYVLTLAGTNTYSGSTRLGNASIRMGNDGHGHWGTLGIPSQTAGVTGPMRVYSPYFLDLNGTSQTVGAVTHTGGGVIYNTMPGTVSTFNFGPYGSDNFSTDVAFQDNNGTTPGGVLALNMAGSGTQTINGVNTYSGDTTVTGSGTLIISAAQAVSPNTTVRLSTTQNPLQLTYSGSASVKRLVINGVEQPNGTYTSASTTAITGSGSLVVTGSQMVVRPTLNFTTSATGGAGGLPSLSFNWSGAYKLQAKTNSLNAAWADYTGGANSPVTVTVDKSKNDVFFRLAPR